jgi:pimeloyl-ACP methyl ester carboxylesterase
MTPSADDAPLRRRASIIPWCRGRGPTLGLARYTLYMQDYGGPVGFRMALAHPDRIESLIVQNAVAHNEGLGPIWKTRRAFWADRTANESTLRNKSSVAANDADAPHGERSQRGKI